MNNIPEMLRRADRREDSREKMQANGKFSYVRVVWSLTSRAPACHVVTEVLQEQAHHAALSLRPHHHLQVTYSL